MERNDPENSKRQQHFQIKTRLQRWNKTTFLIIPITTVFMKKEAKIASYKNRSSLKENFVSILGSYFDKWCQSNWQRFRIRRTADARRRRGVQYARGLKLAPVATEVRCSRPPWTGEVRNAEYEKRFAVTVAAEHTAERDVWPEGLAIVPGRVRFSWNLSF